MLPRFTSDSGHKSGTPGVSWEPQHQFSASVVGCTAGSKLIRARGWKTGEAEPFSDLSRNGRGQRRINYRARFYCPGHRCCADDTTRGRSADGRFCNCLQSYKSPACRPEPIKTSGNYTFAPAIPARRSFGEDGGDAAKTIRIPYRLRSATTPFHISPLYTTRKHIVQRCLSSPPQSPRMTVKPFLCSAASTLHAFRSPKQIRPLYSAENTYDVPAQDRSIQIV